MAQDNDWDSGQHKQEFNSLAAKAAAFAANNPQLQGKAQFGATEPEKPAMGDKNDPSTWKVEGGAASGQGEFKSERDANAALAQTARKNKFKL